MCSPGRSGGRDYPDPDFSDLCGGLPSHQDEVMTGHSGQPTVEVQDRRHGAGKPAVDQGMTDQAKYGGVA
jgi:hypothetical protein